MHKLSVDLKTALFFILLSHTPILSAEEIHGRIQLTGQENMADDQSLDAQLDEQYRQDFLGDLRLTWEPRFDNWDIQVHYQLTADHGDNVSYTQKLSPYFEQSSPVSLTDLSHTIHDGQDNNITHRLDRLAIGYSTPDYVVRVGRQTLTWGTGKMFQVMDLVAPFAPDTVDTEYKPGADMTYMQWLYEDGSDLQFALAPRRAASNHHLQWTASTAALYYRQTFGELNTSWLLAHDYESQMFGLGLSGALGGASWNTEVVSTRNDDGDIKVSALANIDYALMLLEHNATVFSEYYHNGYGTHTEATYDTLPGDLLRRLDRGQVFNLNRNYLASGMTFEWTPLLNLSSSLIVNLDDLSAFGTAEINWSLSDNSTLLSGFQFPVGPENTEYGGVRFSQETDIYVTPAWMVYLQLRHYF
ncbi:hypothetical protein [Vibrio mangrovi]|uniref:Alginate export domain-containing protein n=1 Tax=Vibrio mangrovi TaxID=474394 RepID=A0A1Y6IMJ3_9VIBR|nr:hypothetical protein [Vibrio mangrovi]MDW6004326.1 hypothetical protein [Vibrio mangrovi]SMR98875.1 hypothetical protein VIM7927_00088 [Vibrio mangrovi]